jgi:hypothetical protein
VRAPHDVEQFLVTDPQVAHAIHPGEGVASSEERLLVSQSGDELGVSLFVHRDVVSRLERDSPADALHPGNLADFLTALEGVSHFLYLTWNAHHRRSVSLLELEMQAEVDKWISSAMLFGRQQRGRIPALLRHWLFEQARIDEALDEELATRYRDASFYAGKYCRGLEARYLRAGAMPGLLNELRRFYRLGRQAKMSRIDRDHRPH